MRIKELLQNVLLALSTVLVTLLVVEAGFRVHGCLENRGLFASANLDVPPPADAPATLGHLIRRAANPRIVYELKPGISAHFKGAHVTINEQGFRGPYRAPEKPDGVFRIVGLGDSIMFGYGVADGECYLRVLEDRMNELGLPFTTQVVNLAVPGYNTPMEVETLKAKGLVFRPDLVLIELVYNDLQLPNFLRRDAPVISFKKLFLYDWIRGRLKDRDRPKDGEPAGLELPPKEAVPKRYRGLAGWEAFERAMEELHRLAEAGSFELAVLVVAPNYEKSQGRLKEMTGDAERLGIPVLWIGSSLRRYLDERGLRDYLGSPLAYSSTDGHPSALGHRLAGERLLEMLSEEGLVRRD